MSTFNCSHKAQSRHAKNWWGGGWHSVTIDIYGNKTETTWERRTILKWGWFPTAVFRPVSSRTINC